MLFLNIVDFGLHLFFLFPNILVHSDNLTIWKYNFLFTLSLYMFSCCIFSPATAFSAIIFFLSSPLCSSGLITYFVSYILIPAQSFSQLSHSPQAVSHSVSFKFFFPNLSLINCSAFIVISLHLNNCLFLFSHS